LKDKCIARQEAGQKLHFYIFDVCAYGGVDLTKKPIIERIEILNRIPLSYESDYVEFAQYYRGPELWDKLQEYLASGREGIVITRKDCPIYFKRTPAHMTIKIKKELQETIDVVILGSNAPTRLYGGKEIETWKYWEDTFTGEKLNGEFYKDYSDGKSIEPITKAYFNGWAGSLIIGIRKDDKLIPIGSLSGLEEEVLANWKDYKGKVAEVTAMQIMNTDNQGLRHPKFLRWRTDLTPRDTDYYRFFT
jgi:ATP-dependent DNA ligase